MFALHHKTGAKILAYVKWDLSNAWKGQTQDQVETSISYKKEQTKLFLLETAGAKVLAYFKWELPNKWRGKSE